MNKSRVEGRTNDEPRKTKGEADPERDEATTEERGRPDQNAGKSHTVMADINDDAEEKGTGEKGTGEHSASRETEKDAGNHAGEHRTVMGDINDDTGKASK